MPVRPAILGLLLTALSLAHAQTGLPRPGCPAPVGIENGGFESGQLAPWATPSAAPAVPPYLSIVSPGYQSGHALQLDFPASNVTSYYFNQDMGLQCAGARYFTSFAVNWGNFSIHGDPDSNFCHIDVGSSYCFGPPLPGPGFYNATSDAPGWQYHSYTCTAKKSGYATFNVNIGCLATYVVPAFTWQMDDFAIQLLEGTAAPSPAPSTALPSSLAPSATPSSFPPTVTTAGNLSSNASSTTLSSPTVSIHFATSGASRVRESESVLGPMGLVLLLPYLLYQLLLLG